MFGLLAVQETYAQKSSPKTSLPTEEIPLSLDGIMKKIEKRYESEGFSAKFTQKSLLKAMDITDTASGKLMIRRPGMMRWEYEAPDQQMIITDSVSLWVFRPNDKQVMVGKAPAYFSDGKGASFLSDIKVLRQNFEVTLEKMDEPCCYTLKLLPKEKKYNIEVIYLLISKTTFDVAQIVTYNAYGDQTEINLSDFQFGLKLDKTIFNFTVPKGVDVLKLDEEP
jgi:outer membrane lipoprotein carrier protein